MAIKKVFRKRQGISLWRIDFRDQFGRRVREFAKTHSEAKVLLAKRLVEVCHCTFIHPKERKRQHRDRRALTFQVFAVRFLDDYASTRRSNYYEMALKPVCAFFGEFPLREITEVDIDQFRRARAKQVGASTLRKNLIVLGTMFKQAKRWGLIELNPAADLEKPSEPRHKVRFLSEDEWTRLLKQADPWLKPILTMAVATGLRLKELVSLEWKDVDTKAGLLHVSSDNKTARTRAVPINDSAQAVLKGRRPHRFRSPFVFADEENRPRTSVRSRNRISQHTKAAMRAADIEGASFHTIRHTAASWMVQRGRPLAEVREILGHTTMQTTLRYAHLRPEHLRDSISALDEALEGQPMDTIGESEVALTSGKSSKYQPENKLGR